MTVPTPFAADTARPAPEAEPWPKRRVMATADLRFVREIDAVTEVNRLNNALTQAHADSAAAFSLAEQLQRELEVAKVTIETLRALATIGLNRELPADSGSTEISSDAQAEAQAWLQNYNDLKVKAANATVDQTLLAYILSSFQHAANDWHWLHIVLRGSTPREALEKAMLEMPCPIPSGMLGQGIPAAASNTENDSAEAAN